MKPKHEIHWRRHKEVGERNRRLSELRPGGIVIRNADVEMETIEAKANRLCWDLVYGKDWLENVKAQNLIAEKKRKSWFGSWF